VVKVSILVEGGGDSKELHTRCREGFSKLIGKAGFRGRMPRIVACAGRQHAFDMFRTAIGKGQGFHPILLVDSEDPVDPQNELSYGSAGAWNHLQSRDGWTRPHGTDDDQAQMMVTCMETWIMSDREALLKFFGARLQTSALLPVDDLEQRSRSDVQSALEKATHNCGPDKTYRKGRRSFQVLAELNPGALMDLPHFKRFIKALDSRLPEGEGGIAQCRGT
jgi:hypothetical protein